MVRCQEDLTVVDANISVVEKAGGDDMKSLESTKSSTSKDEKERKMGQKNLQVEREESSLRYEVRVPRQNYEKSRKQNRSLVCAREV